MLLAACTASDDATDQKGAPVVIGDCFISADSTTRVADANVLSNNFENGDEITVNVYKSGLLISYGTYVASAPSSNVNAMTAKTEAFWPTDAATDGGVRADIIGIYPSTINGHSSKFTVKSNQTDKADYKNSDLMVARHLNVIKSNTVPQTLHFSHKLAKVIVTVSCKSPFSVNITQIRMKDVYRAIGISPYDGTVDTDDLSDKGDVIMQTQSSGTTITAVALVPPQTIPISNNCIEIQTDNGNAYYNTAKTVRDGTTQVVRTPLTLEGGKVYSFTLQLTESVIRQQYNIDDFEDGNEDELIGYFNYTGNEQTFTAGYDGTYRFRAWGAAGETVGSMRGGYGGYAVADLAMTAGQTVYISVGGSGATTRWNGGGSATSGYGAGGGATHVAWASGLRSTLSLDDFIMIAGGGGGATPTHIGGDGCATKSGGYLAGNGTGQDGTSLAGGGGGNQGGRNDVGYAYGGSGYTVNGSIDTSTHTGNGLLTISIVN